MNREVLLIPRRLLSRYKHAAIRLGKRVLPQKKALVFVFGGRTLYWEGMGAELYASEPVFREWIRKCDTITVGLGGKTILPNFEMQGASTLKDEGCVISAITSLQIALFHLWKSKGIVPNAIMGVSLGEVAATYAAGGLELEEALQIAASISRISSLENNDFLSRHVKTNLARAEQLCRKAPVPMSVVYEISDNDVLIFAHKDDNDAAGLFLEKNNVASTMAKEDRTWPYHTPALLKHRAVLRKYTENIEHRPLQCDYFSANHGRLLRKGELIENGFWYDLKHKPVKTHSTLRLLGHEGYGVLLHIGPHPFLKGQMLQSAGSLGTKTILLDSMRRDEGEQAVFNASLRRLRAIKRHPPALDTNGEHDVFEEFRNHFNLANPAVNANPYPYLRYLQQRGSVHYLPRHQSWIVLDYEDIDRVLKNADVFSSTIHKTFDEFLLGADPPSHTLIRSALQPLFSQQKFSVIAAYTSEMASALADKFPAGPFNFVDEFSLPLTQAVVAKFLGLTEDEAQTLRESLHGHIYALEYFETLKIFCRNHLEHKADADDNSIASLLLRLVNEGKLPFEGAVNMMRMLWIAGMTTTSMLISTAVHFLAKDPQQASRLRANEDLIPKFIEECLRLEAPESELRRITTAPVELDGKQLAAGSIVMLGLRAANRDPGYFENPDELKLDRPAARHLSFGGGYHYCLGVGMARVEAKQVVKVILDKVPGLRLDEDAAVEYFPSPHFRGLKKLILRNESKDNESK